jgi:hypothetical protein
MAMRREYILIAVLLHDHHRPSPPSFNPDATLFPMQVSSPRLSSSRFFRTCIVSVSICTSVSISRSISYRKHKTPHSRSFYLLVFLFDLFFFFSLHLVVHPFVFDLIYFIAFFAASQDPSIPNFCKISNSHLFTLRSPSLRSFTVFHHSPRALASSPL